MIAAQLVERVVATVVSVDGVAFAVGERQADAGFLNREARRMRRAFLQIDVLPARRIAARHYNRQKIGTQQFVPPGRCYVLLAVPGPALWVTSWPFAFSRAATRFSSFSIRS